MRYPKPTRAQREIAKALDVDIRGCSRSTAAARIEERVGPAVHDDYEVRQPAHRQVAFAHSLGLDVSNDTFLVASAKIDDELTARNREALSRLNLQPGDRVIKRETFEVEGESREFTREFVVSSVQPNLRVFFKGGNGQGAWPTQLEKLK